LNLEFGFELVEATLELPLLAGALAGFEESGARSEGFSEPTVSCAQAATGAVNLFIGSSPEAFTWKKDVSDAGADHLLEVGVSEAVRLNGADVFAGHVPGAKPSIAWRWNTWRKLFRENCSMNEREVQTWLGMAPKPQESGHEQIARNRVMPC
jgi:hypothetical protein